MAVELSVVMPCLNEVETLAVCIGKAQRFLAGSGVTGEVLVADNGSTDGSQDLARSLGARVVDVPIRGYGAALYWGVMAAEGRYCIMGDSDDSYDFVALEPFVAALRAGADLVMGNRFAGGISPGAMPWKNRYIGNPVLSGLGNLLFRSPVRDFHCGLRGVSKAAFQQMDLRTTGMEFASEMVIKATLLGMRIVEVPTTLRPDGRSRPPHLRPWRDGWRHMRFMLLFSPDWLFLYPGLALMALGIGMGALLQLGPVTVNGVRFSVDTLIYCAGVIEIGFQAVLFSILSHTYATQEGLFPPTRRTDLIRRLFTLERGIWAALLLLAVGLILFARAVGLWSEARFGALDPEQITRVVIGSALGLSLGCEVLFSSFLFSMLKLNVRPLDGAGG